MSTLVGTFHRFGLVGPAYEVLAASAAAAGSEPQMRIRVLESGELIDYPVSAILSDPAED